MQTLAERLTAETPTRTAHCDTHGKYTSRQFLGSIWTKCPKCTEDADRTEAETKRQADQERRLRVWEQRLGHAGIPDRFRDRTLDTYVANNDGQRRALKFARGYAEAFDQVLATGQSAVFVGKPGTGKTHLAVGIALHVMREGGRSALFSTVMRAVRRVKDTWGKGSKMTETEAIESLVFPDLLILDEVGVQFGSETEKLLLFDVLNERYEHRRPTVTLSNLTLPEVQGYLGERIFDRLREDGGQIVVFDWESARGHATTKA